MKESEKCEDIKMFDTYIFPILFSYRHSIEISLKHIYQRARGKMPEGEHNLLTLWDKVKNDVIDEIICSEDFISLLKMQKTDATLVAAYKAWQRF